jgi:serpin B
VLCNAIYFKGRWRTQFKPGDTKPAQFHVGTNQDVTAQMMHQKCNCKLASLFDWMGDSISMQIIELPYFGGDLSMVIFLPQDVDGLQALEQQLTEQNLRQWLGKLNTAREHDVWVSLPRFKTVQSFDLKPALQSLGVRLAFGGGADFSGMDGTKWLYLSKALQQAFVEVNEQGTEAAMVTAGRVKTKSAADRFIADHPFLFLIRDCASGGILFMGRIVDPTRAN